jgi:hypothetical protein
MLQHALNRVNANLERRPEPKPDNLVVCALGKYLLELGLPRTNHINAPVGISPELPGNGICVMRLGIACEPA